MKKNQNLIECKDNGYEYIMHFGNDDDHADLYSIEEDREEMGSRLYFRMIYKLAVAIQKRITKED